MHCHRILFSALFADISSYLPVLFKRNIFTFTFLCYVDTHSGTINLVIFTDKINSCHYNINI